MLMINVINTYLLIQIYNRFVQLREFGEPDVEHSYEQTSQKKVSDLGKESENVLAWGPLFSHNCLMK